jgi:flap endonuclease-1
MGIKGLKSLIKKYAPEAFTEINLNTLYNKTICIDSSILLYKYRYLYDTDNFHILGFLHKTIEFLELGIKPIFVFDGKPPKEKQQVLKKRKEQQNKRITKLKELKEQVKEMNPDPAFINSDSDSESPENETKVLQRKIKALEKNVKTVTRQHSFEVMEFLKSIGIPFFHTDAEAEKSCVFLQKNGYADYIMTEDTDSLTFGSTNVLFCKKNVYTLCELHKVLGGLELNYSGFVDLCILCGCDYTCTIPKVGPVTAYNAIKQWGSIELFLKNEEKHIPPDSFDYETARELFTKEEHFPVQFYITKNKIDFLEILSRWNLQQFSTKFTFCEFNLN